MLSRKGAERVRPAARIAWYYKKFKFPLFRVSERFKGGLNRSLCVSAAPTAVSDHGTPLFTEITIDTNSAFESRGSGELRCLTKVEE